MKKRDHFRKGLLIIVLVSMLIPCWNSCKSTRSDKNADIDESIIVLKVAEDSVWFTKFHNFKNIRDLPSYFEFESIVVDIKTTNEGELEFNFEEKKYNNIDSLFDSVRKFINLDPNVTYSAFVDPDVMVWKLRVFLIKAFMHKLNIFIASKNGFWNCYKVYKPDDAMNIFSGNRVLKINIKDKYNNIEPEKLRNDLYNYILREIKKVKKSEECKKNILLVSVPSKTRYKLLSIIMDLCSNEKIGIKTIFLVSEERDKENERREVKVKLPAYKAGHLKTILTALVRFRVLDGT